MENTGNVSAAGQGVPDFTPTSERVEAIRQSTYLALSKAAPQSLCHYPFASELVTVCVLPQTHTHYRQTFMSMWKYIRQWHGENCLFVCLFVWFCFFGKSHFSAKQYIHLIYIEKTWGQTSSLQRSEAGTGVAGGTDLDMKHIVCLRQEAVPELWVQVSFTAGWSDRSEWHVLLNLLKGLSALREPSLTSKLKLFNQN